MSIKATSIRYGTNYRPVEKFDRELFNFQYLTFVSGFTICPSLPNPKWSRGKKLAQLPSNHAKLGAGHSVSHTAKIIVLDLGRLNF